MLNKISSPRSATHLLKKAATLTMGLMSACSSETVGTRSQAVDAVQNQVDGYINRALHNDASETSSPILEVDASTTPEDTKPIDKTELCTQDWKDERNMDPCSIIDEDYKAPVMKNVDFTMSTLMELFGDSKNPPNIGKDDGGSIHIQDSKLGEVIFQKVLDSRWTIYAYQPKLGMSSSIQMNGSSSSGEPWSISVLGTGEDPHCENKVEDFSIAMNWSPGGEIGVYKRSVDRVVHEDPKDTLCEQQKTSVVNSSCSSGYPDPEILNWCKKQDSSSWTLVSDFIQVYPLEQVKKDLATSFASMAQIIVENDIDPSLVAWFKPFVKK